MPLDPTTQSLAVSLSMLSASSPTISDVVSPIDASPSDAIRAATSLILLHNFVSPEIESYMKKRKSTISADALKSIVIEELETCFLITL